MVSFGGNSGGVMDLCCVKCLVCVTLFLEEFILCPFVFCLPKI